MGVASAVYSEATAVYEPAAGGGGGGVPTTRTITAGAGLTGGGDLSADRTLDVVANADGSIVVNANDVQVGVITDAQHGTRAGGNTHSLVSIALNAAGFMSVTDKSKLDGLPTSAPSTARTITAGAGLTGGGDLSADRTIDVAPNADGSIVVNADDIQVGVLATDAQHGNRGNGALHAQATPTVDGFMSAADKAKLDVFTGVTTALTAGTTVGWTTVYSVDFTQLPSQTLNAATATIDGRPWSVLAQATVNAAITQGRGLVLSPTAASAANCGVYFRLRDVIGDGFGFTRFRIRARMIRSGSGLNSSSTNYGPQLLIQWDNVAWVTGSNNRTVFGHESESSTLRIEYFGYASGVQSNPQSNNAWDDAFLAEFDGTASLIMRSGIWDMDWPNPAAMRMRGIDSGLAPIHSYNPPRSLNDIQVGFYMYSGATPAHFGTITHMKIEVDQISYFGQSSPGRVYAPSAPQIIRPPLPQIIPPR